MSNKKFTTHTGTMIPLDITNVDTDAIIPKQFLTKINKIGFGKHLFHEWRFIDKEGEKPNTGFVLNNPIYSGSQVLLTRENFGCGSSREHAPWALADYGFKAIISSSFADIFYGNCLNNFILPITLTEEQIEIIFQQVNQDPKTQITIDLANQIVTVANQNYTFEIDPFKKHCIYNGLNSIDLTFEHKNTIDNYEAKIPTFLH